MLRLVWLCLPRSPPLLSSIRSRPIKETLRRDHASRFFQHRGHWRRYVFLFRRNGWPATLSGPAHPSACFDEGRQSRPRPDRTWPAAARRQRTLGAETDRHLGFGSALRCLDGTVDRPRVKTRPQMSSILPYLDIVLALLVLGVAGWTIAARDLFAAVVGYVAYGLLLAFVWVRLYAPDVALTEGAGGGGVTGVLLITAGKRLGAHKTIAPEAQPGLAFRILAGV